MNYHLSWFLRHHGDQPHSLEDLAAAVRLPVSRVKRDLDDLSDAGFQFDQHPTLGLRVVETPVRIDRDEVAFGRAGRRVGHTVHVYDRTASTNDVAADLAAAGVQTDGVVVVAEEQSAGRGRQGARWFASRGESLLVSTVHWMAPGPDVGAELMLVAGVAAVEAIGRVAGVRVGIKWPNDVEINRRKAAGILVEQPGVNGVGRGSGEMDHSGRVPFVIGIGVNVNQPEGTFPPEIAAGAISVRMGAGHPVDRVVVLDGILDGLEECFERLAAGALDGLLERYMAHCDMIGRKVTVREGGADFHGTVASISPHYALILHLEEGGYRSFKAAGVRLG